MIPCIEMHKLLYTKKIIICTVLQTYKDNTIMQIMNLHTYRDDSQVINLLIQQNWYVFIAYIIYNIDKAIVCDGHL